MNKFKDAIVLIKRIVLFCSNYINENCKNCPFRRLFIYQDHCPFHRLRVLGYNQLLDDLNKYSKEEENLNGHSESESAK